MIRDEETVLYLSIKMYYCNNFFRILLYLDHEKNLIIFNYSFGCCNEQPCSKHISFNRRAAGIGTSSPTHSLTFGAGGTGVAPYNTADQTTNYERARLYWSSNLFTLQTELGGTGVARNIRIYGNASNLYIGNNTLTNSAVEVRRDGTSLKTLFAVASAGLNSASGQQNGIVVPTITQTSGAGYNALFVSPFEQSVGSGNKYLLNVGTNSAANGA